MPDSRSRQKKMLGAWASAEIWEGIEVWRKRGENRTITDFVLESAVEKLKVHGIRIDPITALADNRYRTPGPDHFNLNEGKDGKPSDKAGSSKYPPIKREKTKPKTNSTGAVSAGGPLKPLLDEQKKLRRRSSKPGGAGGQKTHNDPQPPRNGKGESSPPSGEDHHRE